MKVKTKQFVRKPIYVEAVKVTAKNFDEILKWAGGTEAIDEDRSTGTTKKYIRIETQQAKTERQKKAFIGDWVLKTDRAFKIYSNYAFHRSFDAVEPQETQVSVDPKQSDVFLKWMAEDFKAYWGTLKAEQKEDLIRSWVLATDGIVTPPTPIENVNGAESVDEAPPLDVRRPEANTQIRTEAEAREDLGLPEKGAEESVPLPVDEPKPVVEDSNGVHLEDSPTAPPVHQA